MKAVVSIPDKLFAEAERWARKMRRSRSRLYGDALREYLLMHAPNTVTEAMNKVCEKLDPREDRFVSESSRRMLRREAWRE